MLCVLGRRCDGEVQVFPLHHRLDLLEACADLVNAEWPRSRAARIHGLQKSCQNFPVCLVLLERAADEEQLLGHARLSRVVGQCASLFVETVVVCQAQRGKGYGRKLMEAAERYARTRGFRRLCLTTHDKQHFYAHLGYVLSKPVQNVGAMTSFMPMEVLQKFSRIQDTVCSSGPLRSSARQGLQKNLPSNSETDPPQVSCQTEILCPKPLVVPSQPSNQPPQPPQPLLAPPLPPQLPATCHPIPSVAQSQSKTQTLLETPYRDVKGMPIYWMHKDI